MLDMVNRIHSQMKDIILVEKPIRLEQLVDNCLRLNQGLLDRKSIQVQTFYNGESVVKCDPVHLSEAISNVLTNAVEAMGEGGKLTIELVQVKKSVQLTIQDNGKGIPARQLEQYLSRFQHEEPLR